MDHPRLELLLQTLANSPEGDKSALMRAAIGLLREVCNIHTKSSHPKFQSIAEQVRNLFDQILLGKIEAKEEEEFLESADFNFIEPAGAKPASPVPSSAPPSEAGIEVAAKVPSPSPADTSTSAVGAITGAEVAAKVPSPSPADTSTGSVGAITGVEVAAKVPSPSPQVIIIDSLLSQAVERLVTSFPKEPEDEFTSDTTRQGMQVEPEPTTAVEIPLVSGKAKVVAAPATSAEEVGEVVVSQGLTKTCEPAKEQPAEKGKASALIQESLPSPTPVKMTPELEALEARLAAETKTPAVGKVKKKPAQAPVASVEESVAAETKAPASGKVKKKTAQETVASAEESVVPEAKAPASGKVKKTDQETPVHAEEPEETVTTEAKTTASGKVKKTAQETPVHEEIITTETKKTTSGKVKKTAPEPVKPSVDAMPEEPGEDEDEDMEETPVNPPEEKFSELPVPQVKEEVEPEAPAHALESQSEERASEAVPMITIKETAPAALTAPEENAQEYIAKEIIPETPLQISVARWNTKVEPWLQIALPVRDDKEASIAVVNAAAALRSNLASAVSLTSFQKEELKRFDKYWKHWQGEILHTGYEVFPSQFGKLPEPIGEVIYSCQPNVTAVENVLIIPGLRKPGKQEFIIPPVSLVTLPPGDSFPIEHQDRDLAPHWRGVLGELELLCRHLEFQKSVVCAIEIVNKSRIEPLTQCYQGIINEITRRAEALRNAVRKRETIFRLATNYWRLEECFWAIFQDDGRPAGYSFFDRLRKRVQSWRTAVREQSQLLLRDFVPGRDPLASVNKYIGNIVLQNKPGVAPGIILRELRPALVVKVHDVTRLLKGRVIST